MSTKRFRFKFALGDHFARELEEANELPPGFSPDEYEGWRIKNKLVDNLSNRFRYWAMRDKENHEKGL
jgi:hypothetical protein